ncbi:hypothetical protein E2C01_051710 [Portunus trituberculatus]|uniref:Uncharacterized protein n=1 Tax=Portunus trituberculatus TaxID=210409 RepID=A0A5B7GJT3_PORTR|nr:hypothetical protein [Portunus trituberculatus]
MLPNQWRESGPECLPVNERHHQCPNSPCNARRCVTTLGQGLYAQGKTLPRPSTPSGKEGPPQEGKPPFQRPSETSKDTATVHIYKVFHPRIHGHVSMTHMGPRARIYKTMIRHKVNISQQDGGHHDLHET